MPCARARLVHKTEVPRLLRTTNHLHGSRTQKELFLKKLDTLFSDYRGIFNSGNTVIVDDTPLKHIMNRSENVVLSNPWSNYENGERDTFLLRTLLLWFQ